VLICLTKAGLTARDAIVAGAQQRQRRLLEQLGNEELEDVPWARQPADRDGAPDARRRERLALIMASNPGTEPLIPRWKVPP
jgi:hypothetical protein